MWITTNRSILGELVLFYEQGSGSTGPQSSTAREKCLGRVQTSLSGWRLLFAHGHLRRGGGPGENLAPNCFRPSLADGSIFDRDITKLFRI